MNRRSEFLDVLLRGAGPSPELLGAFALGLIVVGILGNLAYDMLIAPAGIWLAAWRPLVAAALLTGLAYLLYRLDRRRGRTVRAVVDESRLAPPHAGLIWLFGPGPFEHLVAALRHHQQEDATAHCWLVMEEGMAPVKERFGELSKRLVEEGIATQLHPAYIEQADVRATYETVRTVFEREAAEVGLEPHQVIADITGGTKPMTTGMALAALTTGGALEYVESERDSEGRPIEDTQRVVLVDTTFYVTTEE
ncbi:MAG: hypothetical protein JXA14_25770 [Anaerolineae bacterium]|nr:hypothetical protein [Anaerolineae bacterium]